MWVFYNLQQLATDVELNCTQAWNIRLWKLFAKLCSYLQSTSISNSRNVNHSISFSLLNKSKRSPIHCAHFSVTLCLIYIIGMDIAKWLSSLRMILQADMRRTVMVPDYLHFTIFGPSLLLHLIFGYRWTHSSIIYQNNHITENDISRTHTHTHTPFTVLKQDKN